MGEYHSMAGSDAFAGIPAKRDPFYVVKDKAQLLLVSLSSNFDTWKDALDNSNTASNAEFQELTAKLNMELATLKVDLKDLKKTIEIVNQNRSRFKDIDDHELNGRRSFVSDAMALVEELESTMGSTRTQRKLAKDKNTRSQLLERDSARGRQNKAANSAYVTSVQTRHEQTVVQQDEVLDDMTHALGRLGGLGLTIGAELETQKKDLTAMDGEMDGAMGGLGSALGKMEKILGKSDKGKMGCICVEVVVIVTLLVLVVYT